MVSGCRRLTAAVPELLLPTHHFTILQVRPYRMPVGWSVNVHEHAFFEVSIILEGSTAYPSESGRPGQVLHPGHVYFHGPHVPHSWRSNAGESLRMICWFNVDPVVQMTEPARWPNIPQSLTDAAALMDVIRRQTPGWQNQAAARLGAILSRIIAMGNIPPVTQVAPNGVLDLVPQVDAFLGDNFKHHIQLEDVANAVGTSVSSLIHRYRQIAGTTVGQRLLALRMDETAHLLKTTNIPLKKICDQVGLSDPAYLCRLFRRYFRTSPGEYRSGNIADRSSGAMDTKNARG